MNSRKFFLCVVFLCSSIGSILYAQQRPPFYADIRHFVQEDSLHFPDSGQILFVGSSSFTKWTDVQDYFPRYTIINRGFGGSTLVDVIRYAGDIIYPYHPRQVVVYCGDNDFAVSDTVKPSTVVYRFGLLFGIIRQLLPEATIDYVSIKYSPSREKLWPKIKQANAGIERFMKTQKNAAFIDITVPMAKPGKVVDENLFLEDQLHLKPEGYRIWQKTIEPYLK